MKKMMYLFVSSIMLLGGVNSVSASSFYVNTNGVSFNEKQYNFISNLYYDGYQETMTQEELNKMVELDLFEQPIFISESNNFSDLNNMYNPKGTSITTGGRTTKIAKSCSIECLVTLTTTWNSIPTINSYDVIGFRVTTATINAVNKTTIRGTNYSETYQSSSAYQVSNGIGYSVKLGNVSNMKITTSMYTSTSGTIYGSYQHAMSNISLATSKLYTIGAGGYGSVFNFYGNSVGKFDCATGVNIVL